MSELFNPRPFRCTLEDAGDGTARVLPAGELDMATVGELDACFRDAHSAGFRRIVADLRELEFMDSTGLTLLTRWALEPGATATSSPSRPAASRSGGCSS